MDQVAILSASLAITKIDYQVAVIAGVWFKAPPFDRNRRLAIGRFADEKPRPMLIILLDRRYAHVCLSHSVTPSLARDYGLRAGL
jgi:hypothetical protein